MLNKARIASQLQIWFAAGGPVAALIIQETGITPERYNAWVTVAIAILPGLISSAWGWWSNREAGQIKATESLPNVTKVVVTDTVNGAVRKLATTNEAPGVVTESQNRLDVLAGRS